MTKDHTEEWELLADKGMYVEAAELLVMSTNNPGSIKRKTSRETDYLHAGQCYAFAGEEYYAKAISHFVRAHKADRPERNLYISATISFLRRDVPALENALKQMKELISTDNADYHLIRVAEVLLAYAKKGNFSYKEAFEAV